MPEPPDFDQIALSVMDASDDEPGQSRIADALRQVWNARGAADCARLNMEGFFQILSDTLHTLDR